MRPLFYLLLLLFGPAILPEARAASALCSGRDDRAMKAESQLLCYSEITNDQIQENCRNNLGGAAVDRADSEATSICVNTYKQMKTEAQSYQNKKATKGAQIANLSKENACESNPNPKACLLEAAKKIREAAKLEKELKGDLEKAQKKIARAVKKNEAARKRYNQDEESIRSRRLDAKVLNMGSPEEEQQKQQEISRSRALSVFQPSTALPQGLEVSAENGGASDISGYEQKMSSLKEEQEAAMNSGSGFEKAARAQASVHETQSQKYTQEADRVLASANQLGDATKGPKAADGKTSGLSGTKPAGADQSTGSAQGSTGASITNDAPSDTSSNTGSSGSGALGSMAAAGGGAAGSGGGSSSAGSDPYAYSLFPAKPEAPAAASPAAGGALTDTAIVANPTEAPALQPSGEVAPMQENIGITGLSGGATGAGLSATGASRSPASAKNKNGAGARTLVSTGGSAGGAGGGQAKAAATKEAPSLAKDLSSGAVSIGGGDINAAMTSLAEDFGLASAEPLTEAEKEALAMRQGGEAADSATLNQSQEAVIAESNSAPLFTRTRWALERAVKRGDLILGLRKKL